VDEGWNDDLAAFTQTLGGSTLDASLLLMPLVRFVSPTDERWLSTLDAIGERLAHGPLVDRYDSTATDDGLDGDEGSFTMCSFWYVETLARAGRLNEARSMFDRLLSYASPTGLFSEEIGPNGRLIGNFPQAFTHLALISAAIHLDELLA
ncbi:MAG: GH15 family glucan-1,4-alpha-glucosidase, partial [Ilumatobacter sp.]